MASDLMDLLARSAEEMKVHLCAARVINAPVSQILIIHPFYSKDVVHGSTDDHRRPHEGDGFLPGHVRTIRDLVSLQKNQVPTIVAAVERKLRAHDLKVLVFVDGEIHYPLQTVEVRFCVARCLIAATHVALEQCDVTSVPAACTANRQIHAVPP